MPIISSLLNEFQKKRILVVGEISDAKCSESKPDKNEKIPVASAALAAIYAAKLGAIVALTGTVGADQVGSNIINRLRDNGVDINGLVLDPLKASLCWKKLHKGAEDAPYNLITEKQITEQALKYALNVRAILYVCQSPASHSQTIYKELKKISEGLKIPLAVFAHLDTWKAPARTKKSALLIGHAGTKQKLSKELCAKNSVDECLIINKSNEFNIINKKHIKHFKTGKKLKLYEHEAMLSTLATLLLACNKYPSGLAEMTKHALASDVDFEISISAAAASS